jgi:hypothetical protein
VENKANEVEEIVQNVKKEAGISFGEIMGGVHAMWLTTQGVVRAAGGSISTVFRTLVGTTLGAISILTPIFQAEVAAHDYVSAAMGFASIALALSALIAAEAQEQEFSDALRGANMALHGIQAMIGSFNF